jgi:hypothetical protein
LKENIDYLIDAFLEGKKKKSSKTLNDSKKRPNAIEGTFYAIFLKLHFGK